jgi:hypothetical protein
MSLSGILAVVPKDWRAPIIVAALAGGVVVFTLVTRAKAADFVEDRVEERVAPIRKTVKVDHAIMRHVFEHIEDDAVLHGQKHKHTLADVKKEADQADEDESAE